MGFRGLGFRASHRWKPGALNPQRRLGFRVNGLGFRDDPQVKHQAPWHSGRDDLIRVWEVLLSKYRAVSQNHRQPQARKKKPDLPVA